MPAQPSDGTIDRLAIPGEPLSDPFGRMIRYLRVSVTDRCDFRCVYCMAEAMSFLPKAELLSLEETRALLERSSGIRTRTSRRSAWRVAPGSSTS